MSVDLSQFHQVFIEESVEGLDVMETALMDIDPSNIDSEAINAIFRCAHSIKGGSATFGFGEISEFTHVLETLLDQIRSGKRSMSSSDVNLFLESVDCMREMLALVQAKENAKTDQSVALKAKFDALLEGQPLNINAEVVAEKNQEADSGIKQLWKIQFEPGADILQTGNDPTRILRALSELGHCQVEAQFDGLPALTDIDPETLYLSWSITLESDASKEEILELFEWIIDESEVVVESFESDAERWSIVFKPYRSLFLSGNDPLKIISNLQQICSDFKIKALFEELPSLSLLDPESCFVGWEIQCEIEGGYEKIKEIFEWVEDQAAIQIQALDDPSDAPTLSEVVNEVESEKSKTKANVGIVGTGDQGAPQVVANANARTKKSQTSETSSIRVGIDKIDNLINMVGELVITQSMLGQLGTNFDASRTPQLIEGLSQLEQNTRELQESVMRIRMLPISFAFSRFPRMVRDLGQQLGKNIDLIMQGEQTELDKTVMEKIGDPLVHLVRNAIDHGIEVPEDRRASGKPEFGTITLNAYHQGGNVVIEIADDGKGLDRDTILKKAIEKKLIHEKDALVFSEEQVFDLIFQPGFSTAKEVSDVSGRGVGMDVVKRNIQALNGVVEIHSKKGEGSTIRIRLPLTLAILDGQLARVGENTYIIPLVSIVESMQCRKENISHIAGGCAVFKLRDDYVPIVNLSETFSIRADYTDIEQALLVVVEADGEKVAIVVDELLAQQQVVIKSLEQNYRRVEGISGATILGDGTVALIADIPGIVKLAGIHEASRFCRQNVFNQTPAPAARNFL